MKKLIKSKLKGLPDEQVDMIINMVSDNPDFFKKIQNEVEAKKKGGKKKDTDTDTDKTPVERRQYANTSGGETENISSGGSEIPEVSPSKGGKGHRFPYGYCTWYVAQKRHVPWGGNAGAWLANSKAYGYKTGKTPAVGAVVVTTENRYYGHVAYVEKVSGSTITISEMNYTGWGKTSRRTLDKNSRVIRGYVY